MSAVDYIVIGVIVLIVGGAIAYIFKAKKSGRHCIGCPDSSSCKSCSSCASCHGDCRGCGKTEKDDSE